MSEDIELGKRPPGMVTGPERLLDPARSLSQPDGGQHPATEARQLQELLRIPLLRENGKTTRQAFRNLPHGSRLHRPLGAEIQVREWVSLHDAKDFQIRRDFISSFWWALGWKCFAVNHFMGRRIRRK